MKMKKKSLIIIAVIVIIGVIGFSLYNNSKKLKGEYTAKVHLLLMESESSLIFDGDTVTENTNGKEKNKGIYEISGDQLQIKLGDYNMTAELSKDKKSFVIKSAEGLAGLANGTKYTKEGK
ncbi:hypothetical protein ACWY2R_15895 [Enterococcus avium]|uniref:hypothetical protein n=1 Tax=Enterococcus sp. TaxID=35783 RepID=UPI002906909C|nr:hypothetical protein [Enterococcus sp.]MDU5337163.1 hypothetical protein [Enterococcus sp.]